MTVPSAALTEMDIAGIADTLTGPVTTAVTVPDTTAETETPADTVIVPET